MIPNFFITFLAKILITTGYPEENGTHSEVINPNNDLSICEDITDAPYAMYGGAGGLVNNKIFVCGGKHIHNKTMIDKCFVLGQEELIGMTHERNNPSSFTHGKKVSFNII